MKNAKKILLLVLCAALLVSATIAGTVAYLTSNATVTNTFTVGKVVITMDETDVDVYGVKDGETRVTANSYLLVPGHTYTKDPTVHVAGNSENSWVFVKVVNNIAANVGEIGIDDQILANGWYELSGVDGVYYQEYTKQAGQKDLKVFETFTVADTVEQGDSWTAADNKQIVVTAYAIQKANGTDTFEPAEAWAVVSK